MSYCCENCFRDKEIIGYINSNSTVIDDCDFCESLEVNVIEPRELEEKFSTLIEIYEYLPMEEAHPDTEPQNLLHLVQSEWNIFNEDIENNRLLSLFRDIFIEEFEVPLDKQFVKKYRSDDASQILDVWNSFSDEIKHENRFFIKENVDLQLLESLFKVHQKAYSRGKYFYRARVCDEEKLNVEDMGKPPKTLATSGRANPVGIPYLYISTDINTVFYETRASHLDYVTVAELRLNEELRVLKLRGIKDLSPFILEDFIHTYAKYQFFLTKLEEYLSKPLRRHDDTIDYLPTQYLCEFAKSLGYDAIEYGSSLSETGVNLAVFNDEKLDIKETSLYEIKTVEIDFFKI